MALRVSAGAGGMPAALLYFLPICILPAQILSEMRTDSLTVRILMPFIWQSQGKYITAKQSPSHLFDNIIPGS
jgi:hypothetical protein